MRKVKPAQRISTVAFPIKNIEPFDKSLPASKCAIGSVISLLEDEEAMYAPYLLYYRILTLDLIITEFLCRILFFLIFMVSLCDRIRFLIELNLRNYSL